MQGQKVGCHLLKMFIISPDLTGSLVSYFIVMLQHGISICVFSWYDTFNCLGTELQLWDIERHQWIQVKATTVESPGPGMECWRHGGEMEGWWTVTVHVVSVVCSHPAPHRAGTSQDTFPGFSPGFFLPDPLTCSRDTARVTGKYLSTEKKYLLV